MTDYEALYARLEKLLDEYCELENMYTDQALAGGRMQMVYTAQSNTIYRAIVLLQEVLDGHA